MELAVQKREKFGRQVNALRKQGLIPAELYGKGVANVHLTVPAKDFSKVFKQAGESTVIQVVLEGKKVPAMINDVDMDPISDAVRHVDFFQVRLDEKIKVRVPVSFVGESEAVKSGGVLVKAMKEIEVEALPTDIPRSLEVNLGAIKEIGQSAYIKDIKTADNLKILANPETVVVTVTEKAAEEVVAPAPAVDLSAIKTEGEEKRAEKAEKATVEGASKTVPEGKKEEPKKP